MPMSNKTIFDISYFAHWQGNLTGIPRMINELITRFAKLDDCVFVSWDNVAGGFYEVDIKGVSKHRGKGVEKVFIRKRQKTFITSFLWLLIRLMRKLSVYRIRGAGRANNILTKIYFKGFRPLQVQQGDRFFIPMGEWASREYTQSLLAFASRGVHLIQVIHDMLPLVTPQYSGHSTKIMDRYCSHILPKSSLVLAVSESTKKDIKEWMNTKKLEVPPIRVFRHGEDFAFSTPTKPTSKLFVNAGLKGNDFLLCVGTIEARKNHTLLYYVYKLAKEKGITLPTLIIVGRQGWRTEDIVDIISHDPEVNRQMLFLKNITDSELAWLYDNCLFSVYPSFYEGWGMPIAESIAHGSPCISSNTSSMPEIAGELISYFDPASTDQCLTAIEKLLKPAELKAAQDKIKKFKPTTWDETFVKVSNYIRELGE
jgi:glycosyltransferase involved in cell wall biosynthesis